MEIAACPPVPPPSSNSPPLQIGPNRGPTETDRDFNIYNKLIRYVGMFYKLAHKLPYFCRRNIYYAFVSSHVAYGIEIYANTSKTLLHKLHILNNKLMRILQQQAPLTPIYQLYNTFNTLPIHLLYNQINIGTGTLFNVSCL